MRAWFNSTRGRWLLVALPIALVVIVAGAVLALSPELLFVQDTTVNGLVVDAATQQPLGGVVVKVGEGSLRTDERGQYVLDNVKSNVTLVFDAPGYHTAEFRVGSGGNLVAKLQPLIVEGVVKDTKTGQPIAGATVLVGDAQTTSDDQGWYHLEGIKGLGSLELQAPGYLSSEVNYQGQEQIDAALNPNTFTVKVINDDTKGPATDGKVTAGSQSVPIVNGQATLSKVVEGTKVTVEVPNFSPVQITYNGAPSEEVHLQQGILSGKIIDEITNQPIANALVTDGKNVVMTAADGSYTIPDLVANATIKVRVDGYDRAVIDLNQERPAELKLRPRNVRALYLTHYGVSADELRDHALQLIDQTEANALVMDVKGDRGLMLYTSNVPLAQQIGANDDPQVNDMKAMLDELKQKNIYTIARIVAFKDTLLAEARPDLAVHDRGSGGLWTDNEGLHWLDPFMEEGWDYNITLGVEAANLGFDEIQYDYVRFPTDAGSGTDLDNTVFSGENLRANREAAISGFLKKADEALKPTGAALAADIFGYVTWRTDDMGIGQQLETMGGLVDYICPMVYPTLYWDGIPRMDGGDPYVNDAPAHPYDIVYLSLQTAAVRLQEVNARAKMRPWLQYYNDYIMDVPYSAAEVELQKQATYDNDITGWMMWDPSNAYAKGGFGPKQQ